MITCKCLLMEGGCPSTGNPFSGGLTKHGLQLKYSYYSLCYVIDLQALAHSLHLVHL